MITWIPIQDNWLNPVKSFHRCLLISSLDKVNEFKFLNNSYHICFDYNKRFHFNVNMVYANNDNFIFEEFLNIIFICNKIFSVFYTN